MSRLSWSTHAYFLIVPDEQLDLFACKEPRLHLATRQLDLTLPADQTLCQSLFPAYPELIPLTKELLKQYRKTLCPHCLEQLQLDKKYKQARVQVTFSTVSTLRSKQA